MAECGKAGSAWPQLALACGQSPCRVAPLALLWRRHIEEYLLAFDHPKLFVASLTTDILVQTLQGERSPLVVIEQ